MPKLVIYNISKEIENSEVAEHIFDQNPEILKKYEDIEGFRKELVFKFSWGKGKDTNNRVFEVSPKMRTLLIKLGKVNLQWNRCPVAEYFSIIQCFRCCQFGHLAKDCSADRAYCTQCGGEHAYKDCKNKQVVPNCINCVRNKASDCAHNARDVGCPEYKRVKRNIINKTDYGSE